MLHKFSHSSVSPLRTGISIVMVLMLVAGGLSAYAQAAVACKASCCCCEAMPEQPSLVKNGSECCQGSKGSGLTAADCMPLAPPDVDLLEASHSTTHNSGLFFSVTAYKVYSPAGVSKRRFQQHVDIYSNYQKTPLFLQKKSLLC